MRLTSRLPRRSSLCLVGGPSPSPDETATGATPHHRAKAPSLRNRAGSPIAATSSAADTTPIPTSFVRVVPLLELVELGLPDLEILRHVSEPLRELGVSWRERGERGDRGLGRRITHGTRSRGWGRCGDAAKILGEVASIAAIRSKGAFAMLTGTAPVPASSGQSNHHRLNRGGNRQLNFPLHAVAINRLRLDPETRANFAKQRMRGKTSKDAMRCLK
jgi:hypothetical protein